MVSFSCVFSRPVTYENATPTTKTESWQYKEETCTYNSEVYAPTTTIATSTDIKVYASLTAGEVLMALMMFILIVVEMIKMMFRALDRIKTKKKFLGYSSAEVEIKDVL